MDAKPALLYALDASQHATVMLALRHYQGMLAALGHADTRTVTYANGEVTPVGYDGINELCDRLNHTGLDFSHAVQILGRDDSDPYVAAARNHSLLSEGTLEVDDIAVVSEGDDPGAYVSAWLWVSDEDAGIATDEEDDEEN